LNNRTLLHTVYMLISSPTRAWEEIIVSKRTGAKVLSGFVYPLIGWVGLAVFIGVVIDHIFSNDFTPNQMFREAIQESCAPFIADFGGFCLSVWLLNKVNTKLYHHQSSKACIAALVGYSMVVVFVLQIVTGLFSIFNLLQCIFQFYIIYIVWEGIKTMRLAGSKQMMSFTLIASGIILLSVSLIYHLYKWLIVILN